MECCRYYYSWVLAMLMWQQSMQIHTFPKVMFKAENFTVTGYSCMPDKVSHLPSILSHCWILCPPCHPAVCDRSNFHAAASCGCSRPSAPLV